MIKSALILRENLIANLFTVKNCLKTKILSYGNEATDFCDKEIPKPGSNYTYLEVVTIDSALKKMKTIKHKCFLKQCKNIEKNSH